MPILFVVEIYDSDRIKFFGSFPICGPKGMGRKDVIGSFSDRVSQKSNESLFTPSLIFAKGTFISHIVDKSV
jgi:hypothetical protein